MVGKLCHECLHDAPALFPSPQWEQHMQKDMHMDVSFEAINVLGYYSWNLWNER